MAVMELVGEAHIDHLKYMNIEYLRFRHNRWSWLHPDTGQLSPVTGAGEILALEKAFDEDVASRGTMTLSPLPREREVP